MGIFSFTRQPKLDEISDAPSRSRRRFLYALLPLLVIIAVVIALIVWLMVANKPPEKDTRITQISLSELLKLNSAVLNVSQDNRLVVNGELTANGAFIIAGSEEPKNPSAGQVYFNNSNGSINYFDGKQFYRLSTAQGSGNTIDGLSIETQFTGDITGPYHNLQITNNSITGTNIINNSVGNGDLEYDSLTVVAGNGLSGGGTVALGGSVTLAGLLGSSIDTSEINDGTILLADLGQNGCNGGEIIKWNGSAWACAADDDSGGGGGAPTGAQYVTISLDGTLSGERVLTQGTNISLTDAGANGNVTINVVNNPTFSGLVTANGGLTVETGDTFTMNGDAFTDLTGTGLSVSGGALQTTLGTAIDSIEITDATILFADLNQNGCSLDDVVKWNGSAWACAPDAAGSGTNTFATFDAANGTDPVADSTSDTMTLVDGSGITITGNAAADSLTIAATLGTSVDLNSAEVTNTLQIGNGGTGAITQQGAINALSGLTTNGDLLYHNGANTTRLPRGANTECLLSNATTILWGSCAGTGTTFFTLAGSSGTPQAINGGDTVTIAAGTNISTSAGGTDTVTVNVISNPTFSGTVTLQAASSVGLGVASAATGSARFFNAAGAGQIDLTSANPGAGSFVITLPAATGTVCLTSGNCAGVGGTGDILQGGNTFGSDVIIGAADGFGLQLIVDGGTAASFSNTGTVEFTNLADSSNAFNIRNAGGDSLFVVDTDGSAVTFGDDIDTSFTVLGSSTIFNVLSDNTEAFKIMDSSSNDVLRIDTLNSLVAFGTSNALDGALQVFSSADTGSITLFPEDPGSTDYLLLLPAEDGTICTTAASAACASAYAGAGGDILQNGNSFAATMTIGTNDSNSLELETGGTTRWSINTSGHLLPNVDDTYDIGDNTHRVRDLFLGPGTAHIGTSMADEGSISYNTTTNNMVLGATNGLLVQNTADSTTAFQVQRTTGSTPVLVVDTTNSGVILRAGQDDTTLSATELFTNWGSCSGTGWTVGGSSATHIPGNSAPLVCTVPSVSANRTYRVAMTVTGYSAGGGYVSLGDGFYGAGISANWSPVDAITTINTNSFSIYPVPQGGSDNSYNGTISAISIRQYSSDNLAPALVVKDSSGGNILELRSSLAANDNTFIGLNSGRRNATGINNTALGSDSLANNTTGLGNTAVGASSLQANTEGFANTAVGASALASNTLGTSNVAIGYSTLQQNTTGSGNTAVGGAALYNNITGSGNIALGDTTLFFNDTGESNIAIGQTSLFANTSGFGNMAVGLGALFTNTTGDNNIAFGANADVLFGDLSNATAIGTSAKVGSSNTIAIGRAGFGDGFEVDKVGINTVAAQTAFQVGTGAYGAFFTMSQAGFTVTGASTSFSANMVGGTLLYSDGTSATITAVNSPTSLTVSVSKTVSAGSSFSIAYPGGFSVNGNGDTTVRSLANATTAFQIQNASGNEVLVTDTTNNKVVLGKASTNNGLLQFNSASGTGSISFSPANPGATAYTITVPAENGTLCTSAGNAACLSAYGGGGGGNNLQQSYDADGDGSDSIIALTTADDGLIFRNPDSGGSNSTYILTLDQLEDDTGTLGGLSIQSAGTGNLLLVTDTTATARDVLTVADGGATTLRNQTDSTAAFRVMQADGTPVLSVDTSNEIVCVGDIGLGSCTYQFSVTETARLANLLLGDAGCGNSCIIGGTGQGGSINFQNQDSESFAFTSWQDTTATNVFEFNAQPDGLSENLLQIQRATIPVFTLNNDGSVLSQNVTDSTTAFQIQNAAGGSVFTADTANNYINILPNNSPQLNAWQTNANTMGALANQPGAVIVNGYLYTIGGYDGADMDDVYYHKVNADGSIGTATATTVLPAARSFGSAATYNGYIYYVGGFNGVTGTTTVYYTRPNADGTISNWATTTALSEDRTDSTVLAVNGYLYVLAGRNNSSALNRGTSLYAKINSNGTVGAWSTSTALPGGDLRADIAGGYSNGYMYIIGGGDSGEHDDVYYASVNPVNGSLGSWTKQSGVLPAELAAPSQNAIVLNGNIYIFGGYETGSVATNEVFSAPLNANGSTGTWITQTNLLPDERVDAMVVTYNGYVYVLGGIDSTSTNMNTVFYSSGSRLRVGGSLDLIGLGNGVLGVDNGSDLGSLGGSLTAGNGLFAGTLTVQGTAVFNRSLSLSGDLSAHGTATFQNQTDSTAAFEVNNQAGDTVVGVDTTNSGTVTVLGNTDGETGAWNTTTSMNTESAGPGTFVYNGYVYAFGGYNSVDGDLDESQYAKLHADGTVGAWSNTTALPGARMSPGAVAVNGYVFIVGGGESPSAVDDVFSAKLNSDGTVGTWSSTTSLPAEITAAAVFSANGFIYVVGGADSTLTALDTAYYARVNPNGTVGVWNTTSTLPAIRSYAGTAVANGYAYVIGGSTTVWNGTSQDDTYYAKINEDGTLGAWASTALLPANRAQPTAGISNGYLYTFGGRVNGGASLDTVYFAKINSNGTIGSWSTSSHVLPIVNAGHSIVVNNGYAYIIGGEDASSYLDDVQYVRLGKTLNIGGNVDLVGMQGGDLTEGGIGGNLTAGNTNIIGTFNVQGLASFQDGASILGDLTVMRNIAVSGGTLTVGTSTQAGNFVISDGTASTVTFKSATQAAATNYDITVPAISGNDTLCLVTLANCSGGGSLFTDGGSQTYLTATGDELVIGSNSSFSAKLAIIGDADEEQLLIRANGTQSYSNPLILFQANGGGEMSRFTVDAVGNQFFGYVSGGAVLAGATSNTSYGAWSLQGLTTGDGNTALGYATLGDMATGNVNIAVGNGAMQFDSSGSGNVALGFETMQNAEGGDNNFGAGYHSLHVNTGDNNIAIGNDTLKDNTSGGASIALGSSALGNNASGLINIAIGHESQQNSEGGTGNISLGYQSLYSNTGNYNVAIGQNAGDSITGAGGNIVIGYNAGENITTGATNIILGYDVDASTATVSNELRIGSGGAITLQADLSTMAATFGGALTVTGDQTIQGGDLTLGTTGTAGSLVISDGSSSSVTIKSATQAAATNYDVTIPAISGNDTFCLQTLANCAGSGNILQNGNSFAGTMTLGTNDGNNLAFETGGTTRWLIDTNGHFLPNVDDTYDIGSNTNRVRDLYLGPASLHIGTNTSDEGVLSYNTATNDLGINSAASITLQNHTYVATGKNLTVDTNSLFVDAANNRVGIGTTSPNAKLQVMQAVNTVTDLAVGYSAIPTNGVNFASFDFQSLNAAGNNWTTSYDPASGSTTNTFFIAAQDAIYTSANTDTLKCLTATGCDAGGDWAVVASNLTIMAYDTINDVLYASGPSATVYRCDFATNCDASGDFVSSYDTAEAQLYSMTFDSTNGVLYVGTGNSGIIYRCDTTTSCDAAGDFTTSYDTSSTTIYSMIFEPASGVIYAGDLTSSIIFRCDTTTDCDASGDWTTAANFPWIYVSDFAIDTVNNALFAIIKNGSPGTVYRCDLSTNCDADADYVSTSFSADSYPHDLAFDPLSGTLMVSSGAGTGHVYRCDVSTLCNASGDFSLTYTSAGSQVSTIAADTENSVFYADDSGQMKRYTIAADSQQISYAQVQAKATSTTNGSESGGLSLVTRNSGSALEALYIQGGRVGIGVAGSAPTADLSFGGTANRTVNLLQSAGSTAGFGLTITAGAGGASGAGNAGGSVTLQGAAGGGTNGNGGSVSIVGGSPSGAGTAGGINIGTTGLANTIQIGNTSGAVTQTINIGTNATGSSTSNLTLGSTIAGTTAVQGTTTITGRSSGSTTTLTVNNSTSTGTILELQDNGTPVLTVADGGTTSTQNIAPLTAATQTSNITVTTVESSGYVGDGVSMVLDGSGNAHMAYYDAINQDLIYTACSDATCSTKTTTTVASAGVSGSGGTSIALGGDGFARIAYMQIDDLYFIQCTNASCSTRNTSAVYTLGTAGYESAMEIAADGFARILLTGNSGLRFVQCTNAACSTSNINQIESFNTNASALRLGTDDFARIAYVNNTQDVRYAVCTNASCSAVSANNVDTAPTFMNGVSLDLDGSNLAYISYYNYTTATLGDLYMAQCTNAACTTNNLTAIDTTGDQGYYNSIELGSDGFARISYTDISSGDLKLAQCTNAACSTKNISVVDAAAGTYVISAIRMASDGFARIAYQKKSTQDLMYAKLNAANALEVKTGNDIGSTVSPFSKLYTKGIELQGGMTVSNSGRPGGYAIDVTGNGGVLRATDDNGHVSFNVDSSSFYFAAPDGTGIFSSGTSTQITNYNSTSETLWLNHYNSSGTALNVYNTATGAYVWMGNFVTGTVLTIANSGATAFRTSTNSASAFAIQNSSSTALFNVNTTNSTTTISGTQPASVAGNGTAASATLVVTGSTGGNTSGITGQTAGAGGALTVTSGAGGASTGASGANTGGAGGAITVTSGAGGNVTSATGTAGSGGTITLQGGAPGTGGSTAGSYGNIVMQTGGGRVGIGTSTVTDAGVNISMNAPDIANGAITNVTGNLTSTTNQQITLQANGFAVPASASTQHYIGVAGAMNSSSSNLTGATLIGTSGYVTYNGTGTLGRAMILYSGGEIPTAGTITTYQGLVVDRPVLSGGGAITSAAGVVVREQNTATNNTGLLLGTLTIPAGNWSIYNSSTNENYFGGKLSVHNDLFIEDKQSYGVQTVTLTDDGTANDTLTPTATYVRIDVDETADGTVPDLLLSEAGAVDGQMLIIVNNELDASEDAFTITDSAGVVNVNGSPKTIGPEDAIMFLYMNDRWISIGASDN